MGRCPVEKCGLSIDNLLSTDVVLADGKFVKANADENPDLFWALRGGGGTPSSSLRSRSSCIRSTRFMGPHAVQLSETADVMKCIAI